MNGTARGIPEDDKKKTIIVSIDYKINSSLKIGTSYYNGSRNFQFGDFLFQGAERERRCVYLWYDNDKVFFQFENIWGKDYTFLNSGQYLILGYKLDNQFQPVFRYEYSKSEVTNLEITKLASGINYYVNDRTYLRSIIEFKKNTENMFQFERVAIELGIKLFKP